MDDAALTHPHLFFESDGVLAIVRRRDAVAPSKRSADICGWNALYHSTILRLYKCIGRMVDDASLIHPTTVRATLAGKSGATMYKAMKYFRYAGRTLVVIGVGADIYSIVVSSTPLRRASEVVSGWALAWAGCKVVGAGGAALGTTASPVGTVIGGIGGCIIGGIGGYYGGYTIGGTVYDWAETVFTPLPEVHSP